MGRNRYLTNKWAMLVADSAIPFLVATMCTISSPAFSSAIVHACEYKPYSYGRWPAEAVAKGAYYAQGAYATHEYYYCFEAFSESAQGACEALIGIINAQPVSAVLRFSYSPPTATINPNFPWSALCKSNSGMMFLTDRGVIYSSPMFDANPGAWYKLRDPVSYTIILTGDGEVEPSTGSTTNTLPIIATVIDQNTNQPPTRSVNVQISIKVDPTSGGHDHGDSTRPRGGIASVQTCGSNGTCWSNPTINGAVVFNFNAPEASGTHAITATCEGCSNTATKTVDVKINGLKPIPELPFYALIEANGGVIGAWTGWHTDNHNLTPAAATVLTKIAVNYRFNPTFYLRDPATNAISFPPVLHLNDASLPWGGVYDICARPNACTDTGIVAWHKPHAEHRRGTVIDVRANGADGSIPTSNMEAFKRYLRRAKLPFLHEFIGTSNEHFHIRLMKKKE